MGIGIIREGLPMGCVHAKHRHPADFRLAELRRLVLTRPSGPGAVGTNVRRRGTGSTEPSLPQRPLDLCPHVGVGLDRQPRDERRTGPLGHDIRLPPSP